MPFNKEHAKYNKPAAQGPAGGTPSAPTRDDSRIVSEIQSFLNGYYGTPTTGKFDKRTNGDLLKFVNDNEVNINPRDRGVWNALRQKDDADPYYFSNNPAETAQNLGEIRAILRNRGAPQARERTETGIRELLVSNIPVLEKTIDTVKLPLPLMLRSENDFDMVVKSLILDKYYGRSPAFPSYDQYPAEAVQSALAGLRTAIPAALDQWAEQHPDQKSYAENGKSFIDEHIQTMLGRYSAAAQAKSSRVTWEQFVGMNFNDLLMAVSASDPNLSNDMKWMVRNYLADNNYLDSSGQFVTLNQSQWGGFRARMNTSLHNLLRSRGWSDQQLAQITRQVRDVGTSTTPPPAASAPAQQAAPTPAGVPPPAPTTPG